MATGAGRLASLPVVADYMDCRRPPPALRAHIAAHYSASARWAMSYSGERQGGLSAQRARGYRAAAGSSNTAGNQQQPPAPAFV